MTSNAELLPLPEFPVAVERFILSSLGPMKSDGARTELRTMLRSYARANVEHHTAAKDAENEALRAEVERLTQELQKAPLRRLQETSARAEQLAEALRDLLEGTGPACNARIRARAALHPTAAQENDDAT